MKLLDRFPDAIDVVVRGIKSGLPLGDSLRQRHSSSADTDQRQVLGTAALLHDFMSQPLQRAVNLRRGHQLRFFDDFHCAEF